MKINLNQSVSKESTRNFYEDHKDYLYPLVAILISFALFLFVILPQIIAFPAKKVEVDAEEKKLDGYVAAREYAGSISSTTLSEELLLSTQALPVEKDYTSMVLAISSAANATNTTIENYRFLLGGAGSSKTKLSGGSIPSIVLQTNVKGTADQIVQFITELSETLPLSEVSELSYANGTSQIYINFFYKPLPSADISSSEFVREKNAEEKETFDALSSLKLPVAAESIQVVPATESGIPSNSPF